MSEAIQVYQGAHSSALAARLESREMIETIKQTVCRGASDAQLRLFIEVCKATGLNPFLKGEIWYVPERGIIMAGRDGYLRVANENPNFDGMETHVERDEKGVPIKATCTVWRKDRKHPVVCEAYYSEYKKSGGVWAQYPSAMISKVAEVLALKRSFAINGVVSEEEVGHIGPQDVADAKIEQMKAGVPYAETKPPEPPIIDAEPVEPEVEVPTAKPRGAATKPYDKFVMYKALGVLKDEFQAMGREDVYRDCLRKHGAASGKRDGLPSDDGGKAARACYREMGALLSTLRAQADQESIA